MHKYFRLNLLMTRLFIILLFIPEDEKRIFQRKKPKITCMLHLRLEVLFYSGNYLMESLPCVYLLWLCYYSCV